MNRENKDWFDGIHNIVNDPFRFKAKLAIGEGAYASLRVKKAAFEAWDSVGAGMAAAGIVQSSAVASTFFAPSGFLAAIGFGAAAVTPMGWVVAAGVVTGGAWLGITRYMQKMTSSRVIVIPDFINTPLDVLALALFDLLTPLALKVAHVDGNIDQLERRHICTYLVDEWGYDRDFVNEGVKFTEGRLSEFKIKEVAQALAEYKKRNPDCNHKEMAKEILNFLHDIMVVDGRIDEREEMAIEKVRSIFEETEKFSFRRVAACGWSSISKIPNKILGSKKRLDQDPS